MKEAFIEKRFAAQSIEIITKANQILAAYEANNIRLTLRQLYYQFIAQDLLPESWVDDLLGTKNTQKNYKRLGNLISDARQAGLIDWDAIEDRNRETIIPAHWKSPAEIVNAAARQYRIDKWANQPVHIEVMAEKDAATSVLEPVCRRLDVGFTANKGYASSSLLYEIGKRIEGKIDDDKQVCVIYLGDHDPSGIDMTRDVLERLGLYSNCSGDVEVVRLALNWDQIEQWNPPENPAKESDPRAASYINRFGDSSWELDAVEPLTLRDLVEQSVLLRRDNDLWEEMVERENQMRTRLLEFARNYRE